MKAPILGFTVRVQIFWGARVVTDVGLAPGLAGISLGFYGACGIGIFLVRQRLLGGSGDLVAGYFRDL